MFARFLTSSSPAYVFDKDGTLVNEGTAIPGASEFLQNVKHRRTPYVILSNTGTRTGVEVAHSLSSTIGTPIPTVNVITARDQMLDAMTAIDVLYQRFVVVEDGGDACPPPRPEDDMSAVCVALFTDGNVSDFTSTATHVAQWMRRGAALWITSCDTTIMRANSDGVVIPHPGPGSVLQCIQALVPLTIAGEVRIFGKGSPTDDVHHLGSMVMSRLRMQGFVGAAREVTMVGDRLDTDVRTGRNNGWSTCLVETGCHKERDTPQFPEDVADMIASNVQDLTNSRPNTVKEIISDLMRDVVHYAPHGRPVAEWIAQRILRRTNVGLTRRIHSNPQF
jgi:ribonucleotide monophosphatase NagD (HAD superfamily)